MAPIQNTPGYQHTCKKKLDYQIRYPTWQALQTHRFTRWNEAFFDGKISGRGSIRSRSVQRCNTGYTGNMNRKHVLQLNFYRTTADSIWRNDNSTNLYFTRHGRTHHIVSARIAYNTSQIIRITWFILLLLSNQHDVTCSIVLHVSIHVIVPTWLCPRVCRLVISIASRNLIEKQQKTVYYVMQTYPTCLSTRSFLSVYNFAENEQWRNQSFISLSLELSTVSANWNLIGSFRQRKLLLICPWRHDVHFLSSNFVITTLLMITPACTHAQNTYSDVRWLVICDGTPCSC